MYSTKHRASWFFQKANPMRTSRALEFKGQIAVDWAAQLHKNIPQLEEEAVNAVGRSWRDSILLLRDQLNARFPNQDQYIAKQISNLLEIVDEVKAMVGAALVEISAQSGEMHANLEDELRLNWIPGFEGARTVAGEQKCSRPNKDLEADNFLSSLQVGTVK